MGDLEDRENKIKGWLDNKKNRDLLMIAATLFLAVAMILILIYKKAVFSHACGVCEDMGYVIMQNVSMMYH